MLISEVVAPIASNPLPIRQTRCCVHAVCHSDNFVIVYRTSDMICNLPHSIQLGGELSATDRPDQIFKPNREEILRVEPAQVFSKRVIDRLEWHW